MATYQLTDHSLIKVSGPEAEKFLQGQLTCDVALVTEQPQLSAHCDRKGRVQSLFYIFKKDGDFYLQLPSNILDHTVTILKKYALFSKVTLTPMDGSHITIDVTPEAWHVRELQNGIPRLYPETIGIFLPHELNLPALGAVSFTKGCYTGQEIVARMEYRGKSNYLLTQATLPQDLPVTVGKPLHFEKITGTVVDKINADIGCQALVATKKNIYNTGPV